MIIVIEVKKKKYLHYLYFIFIYIQFIFIFYLLDFLKEALDEHIKNLQVSTKVLRSKKRIGLVNARLLGANKAKGEVLTFLDAHCECTVGR